MCVCISAIASLNLQMCVCTIAGKVARCEVGKHLLLACSTQHTQRKRERERGRERFARFCQRGWHGVPWSIQLT